jgi:hypothetical protein
MHGDVRVTYDRSKNPGREDNHLTTAATTAVNEGQFFLDQSRDTPRSANARPHDTDVHALGVGLEIHKQHICRLRWLGSDPDTEISSGDLVATSCTGACEGANAARGEVFF